MVAMGEGVEMGWRGNFGLVGANYYILEWISNEVLLYSTGNCIQSPVMEHDGRYFEKKNVCIYVCVCN